MRMRILLNFLATLLVAGICNAAETRGLTVVAKDPATGRSAEVPLYNRSYAVIIGIDRYANLPPDRQLHNAVNDARGVESVLRKQYRFDRIYSLHDEQATRDNIMRLLTAELPKTIGKDDALFVFWAGHGNQERTDDGDLGYLIPHDGSGDSIYGNITMSQLKEDISRAIPAKHIFYAFDACYSGLLTTRAVDKKPSRDLTYLREITKERVRQVLTAGGKGQEALDGGRGGHSVFTGRLIEALEAAGDYVTANELQTILREKVYQDARARGHEQTPGYGTLYGTGDFVFVPNVEQRQQDNKAEMAKIEAELKQLESQEIEAIKHQSAREQREAELKRKAAEAKLKAEQLRQQQFEEEARRQQEMARERERFEADQQLRQSEMTEAQREEERRLAALREELAKKKQTAPQSGADTLAAAVAEIRRLNKEIEGIEATFSNELDAGKKRITRRYDAEIAAVRQAAKQKQAAPVRDEFETEAEYKVRVAKQRSSFTDRIADLERQMREELRGLESGLAQEQQTQTSELRQSMENLAAREYTLGAETVVAELGTYDPVQQQFPVTIRNRPNTQKSAPAASGKKKAKPLPSQEQGGLVKVTVYGAIPLPSETARKFKQEWQAGAVRPEVIVLAGSGEAVRVTLVNDADNSLLVYVGSEFITVDERKRRAERTRELAGEMVYVPKGCFQMGDIFGDGNSDEKPVHEACVSDFAIGKYEVTQGQWSKIMGKNPSNSIGCGDICPVEQVSWDDVQEFIHKLNMQTGGSFRLPTEAEWEYAARSGGKSEKYSGDSDVNAVAWYDKNSLYSRTHPVGQKQANGLGIHDMSGNIWEWVNDWYDEAYYGFSTKNNPQGPSSGSDRVIRGGSWSDGSEFARTSYRSKGGSGFSRYYLGFRLAAPVK